MKVEETYFTFDQIPLLWESTIGIERETLRVDHDGEISTIPHHKEWGTRSHQPYIQTDFAESQIEVITPPEYKEASLMKWLKASHQIVATTNEAHGDLLWPFSMPGIIPKDVDSIKIAQLSIQKEYDYRAYLAELYGKHVQLISGIHYNYQLNPQAVLNSFDQQDEVKDLVTYNNRAYMHLARNYFRYRWFLTYHLGAAPYVAENYNTNFYGTPHKERMRSIRQSRYGYQNKSSVVMDYSNLESFADSLEDAIERKALSLEKELYRDVRLRGSTRVRNLIDQGISYLEFRNIDLNPYLPYGIDEDTIRFIHVFLIALLYMEDLHTDQEVIKGNDMNYHIAESDPLDPCPYKEEGRLIIEAMKIVCGKLHKDDRDCIDFERLTDALDDPSLTLSGKIVADLPNRDNFIDFGLQLAKQHQEIYMDKNYLMHGFEDLELSTQDVLKEAMKIGIKITPIDPSENLFKLEYEGHVEYVRNANMTSHDTLISYYLMENKVATKSILRNHGIRVPQGQHYNSIEEAERAYPMLPNVAMVVKPKNTNYGLGISIFSQRPDLETYMEAMKIAFREDNTVLVEEFVQGTELRFYVQDGKTQAIVERQPAQVIGDGKSTISELIQQVNADPLRGVAHMAPLTYLEQGEVEAIQLRGQGLTFDSIPADGQEIHLRENSNVSTGGISIDRTDDAHSSYKQIAEHVARALEANFCGVDIIIEDYTQPASDDSYSVLEANFNPNISIHRYPGRGQERLLGREVLLQLFPEAYVSVADAGVVEAEEVEGE